MRRGPPQTMRGPEGPLCSCLGGSCTGLLVFYKAEFLFLYLDEYHIIQGETIVV